MVLFKWPFQSPPTSAPRGRRGLHSSGCFHLTGSGQTFRWVGDPGCGAQGVGAQQAVIRIPRAKAVTLLSPPCQEFASGKRWRRGAPAQVRRATSSLRRARDGQRCWCG